MDKTAATIDRVASETLAKVEEKCPIITKTPNEVDSFQEEIMYWYERSLEDGKKIYNTFMLLPNIALKLSRQVILPAKQLVLAGNKALSVWHVRTAIASVVLKVVQPLTDDKGNVIGLVFIPPQLLTESIFYSRSIHWILTEDSNKMDMSMEEIEETRF
ncbi:hypothetical protein ACROYT_G000272 [Oculina patagonica]